MPLGPVAPAIPYKVTYIYIWIMYIFFSQTFAPDLPSNPGTPGLPIGPCEKSYINII